MALCLSGRAPGSASPGGEPSVAPGVEWASEFWDNDPHLGIHGIDQPDYERRIDAVWERLSVNDIGTSHNRTHQKLIVLLAHRTAANMVAPL